MTTIHLHHDISNHHDITSCVPPTVIIVNRSQYCPFNNKNNYYNRDCNHNASKQVTLDHKKDAILQQLPIQQIKPLNIKPVNAQDLTKSISYGDDDDDDDDEVVYFDVKKCGTRRCRGNYSDLKHYTLASNTKQPSLDESTYKSKLSWTVRGNKSSTTQPSTPLDTATPHRMAAYDITVDFSKKNNNLISSPRTVMNGRMEESMNTDAAMKGTGILYQNIMDQLIFGIPISDPPSNQQMVDERRPQTQLDQYPQQKMSQHQITSGIIEERAVWQSILEDLKNIQCREPSGNQWSSVRDTELAAPTSPAMDAFDTEGEVTTVASNWATTKIHTQRYRHMVNSTRGICLSRTEATIDDFCNRSQLKRGTSRFSASSLAYEDGDFVLKVNSRYTRRRSSIRSNISLDTATASTFTSSTIQSNMMIPSGSCASTDITVIDKRPKCCTLLRQLSIPFLPNEFRWTADADIAGLLPRHSVLMAHDCHGNAPPDFKSKTAVAFRSKVKRRLDSFQPTKSSMRFNAQRRKQLKLFRFVSSGFQSEHQVLHPLR